MWKVEFRNVGRCYFPQSRVECHYSFSERHSWASCDWVGLFKVGWSSLREYHTFVWALAPVNYTEGSNVNCCVHFHASYLPRTGPVEYQFVYVDGTGEVCARSAPFSFCAPEPMDDLETLDEECEDMLLVVPKAELLQSRLEECLRERAALLQVREAEERNTQREQEMREGAEEGWRRVRAELESQVADLQERLRQNKEETESLEEKLQGCSSSLESVTAEKDALLAERAQGQQRIRELEDDIKALRQRGTETEGELEKMKERMKKMSMQRRDEEEERKGLQMETEAALAELRCARERLEAGERTVEGLRAELSDAAAQRDRGQAELHQSRLQAAQLTLQLADAGLALREGRAAWAQDREALHNSAEMDRERAAKLSREVQRKEEWLQEERTEREKVEAELGRQRECNRELMGYVRQLEQRLEAVADAKWNEAAMNGSCEWRPLVRRSSGARSSSPSGSSEDENPEALQAPRHAGRTVGYGLCSSPRADPPGMVVVSQPAPVSSPRQPDDDTLAHSSESEGEELEAGLSGSQSSEEETALLLPDHKGIIFSELADAPMW